LNALVFRYEETQVGNGRRRAALLRFVPLARAERIGLSFEVHRVLSHRTMG
jgi:hypothetical protein